MNRFIEKLIGSKEQVYLPDDRKVKVRNAVLDYVRANPATGAHSTSVRRSFVIVFLQRYISRPLVIALAALVICVGGAGTTLAAQGALPGDLLYPVKLHVTEKVRSVVAVSAESKAEVRIAQYEDRLDEAAKLLADNKLTPDVATKVTRLLDQYEADAKVSTAQLAANGKNNEADDLNTELDAITDAHARMFRSSAPEHTLSAHASLNSKIEHTDNYDQVVAANSQTESLDESRQRAASKIKIAEKGINLTKAFVAKKSTARNIDASSIVNARIKLSAAESALTAAGNAMQKSLFSQAFASATEAVRLAQEAKTVLRLEQEYKVKVDIETKSDKNPNNRSDDGKNLETDLRIRVNEQSTPAKQKAMND